MNFLIEPEQVYKLIYAIWEQLIIWPIFPPKLSAETNK